MVDLYFPPGLPGPEVGTSNYAPAFDNAIKSAVAYGTKRRPRCTWVPEIFTCSLLVTPAQLQTLLQFHDITSRGGFRQFLWWDFRQPNDTDKRAVYEFRSRPTQSEWADIFRAHLDLLMVRTFTGSYPIGIDHGVAATDQDKIITT